MVAPQKTRVLVVDDHPIIREFIGELINRENDLCVAAEAESVTDALAIIASGKVDIAVVDVNLKGEDGIGLVSRIVAAADFPIVMLSAHDEAVVVERALQAGARGYVLKLEPSQNVLTAIRRVLAGEIFLGVKASNLILNHIVGSRRTKDVLPAGKLSAREREIFQLLGEGLTARDIAARLSISVKTIQVHRAHIKEKLNLKTGGALTRYAIQCAMLAE